MNRRLASYAMIVSIEMREPFRRDGQDRHRPCVDRERFLAKRSRLRVVNGNDAYGTLGSAHHTVVV